ncbi:MAG: lytic murein transglycosylase B [Gammaproteobacteria bacterium]|nr:lytic murein transglycosylase B [Gammaproteobacteria bacterium]
MSKGLAAAALGVAVALAGCEAHRAPPVPQKPVASVIPKPERPRLPVQPEPVGGYSAPYVTGDFARQPAVDRFVERMASEHGFRADYLNGLLSEARLKEWTIAYMNREAPSVKPKPGGWSRYRAKFLTELHISKGAAFWHRHAAALDRAQTRFGVPPEYVLGIMGVETIYGSNVGKDRVLDALTTLAFAYPRRAEYFTDELKSFLLMTRTERVDPAVPRGSFAGAMGLGQFMPSSFLEWAVDFDGDGRKDLWAPDDAIGSVANYFARHGWQPGAVVVTPAIADGAAAAELESGFDTRYTLAALAGYGIHPSGALRVASDKLSLLRLSTNSGDEYWLGHENFYVITRYNHSTHYAMAVHELAQAIKDRYRSTFSASR